MVLKGIFCQTTYSVYLRAKFQASSIILIGFEQELILPPSLFLYVGTLEPPVLGNMLTGKGNIRVTKGVAKQLKDVARGRLRSSKRKLI